MWRIGPQNCADRLHCLRCPLPLRRFDGIDKLSKNHPLHAAGSNGAQQLPKQCDLLLKRRICRPDEGLLEEDEGFNKELKIQNKTIMREKLPMKPMAIEEASLQLELAEEPFIVFSNVETQQVNVMYARSDGTYGLIEPQF